MPVVIFGFLGRGSDILDEVSAGCWIFPWGAEAPQMVLYDLGTFGRDERLSAIWSFRRDCLSIISWSTGRSRSFNSDHMAKIEFLHLFHSPLAMARALVRCASCEGPHVRGPCCQRNHGAQPCFTQSIHWQWRVLLWGAHHVRALMWGVLAAEDCWLVKPCRVPHLATTQTQWRGLRRRGKGMGCFAHPLLRYVIDSIYLCFY